MDSQFTVYVTKFQNLTLSSDVNEDEIFPGVKNAIFKQFVPAYNREQAIKYMLWYFKHELMLYNTTIIYSANNSDKYDDEDCIIKNRQEFLNYIRGYVLSELKHVSFTYINMYNETVKFDICQMHQWK